MDVIQQAREAIAVWDAHAEDDATTGIDAAEALRAVVAAADAGHLIDTRRIERVLVDHGLEVFPTLSTRGRWTVYHVSENEYLSFHASAAEALAAAEREAQ